MESTMRNQSGFPPEEVRDTLSAGFTTSYAAVMTFIAVAKEESFAKAGDRLGIGRSSVSRNIQKLEQQLGTKLFSRTTRSVGLTAEGEIFYESCKPGIDGILNAIERMRDLRGGPPRGLLRISSTVGFGRKVVAPLVSRFRSLYPEVSIDLMLCDSPANFTSDGIDIAFRNGRVDDSQIIARRIIPMHMLLCASPEYALEHGLPMAIQDLSRHRAINFRFSSGRIYEWEFKVAGDLIKHPPSAHLTFNDADLVLNAVLDGLGIAQVAGYQACDHIAAGRLISCMDHYAPDDRSHFLCYLSKQHMPSRMRLFIDFMLEQIRMLNLQCAAGDMATNASPRSAQ
ncbi:Transcriptional regulator, LysR family (plasmid) [Paraburkholderia caribensis MBA4]|uniref:Transcriptional regulator, LysR family n=1 Tax=Paraburkholderia caribensis MBA4 TaxID=1323664 RepID=A0A0P0RQF1_9BURK|nr:LysR family transcriptional regulator [Paraburkholderia caribensis]ALL71179.1 Transcriptional regulator, LysR family [Paraburkholderia caribensis MBA4]